MYRIMIIEDDRGIAQAIREQAELWDLQVYCEFTAWRTSGR